MSKSSEAFLEQREQEATEPISTVKLKRASLNIQIQSIVQSVESGNVNPLEAFIYLNFMQKVADGARKKLLEQASIEAEKYEKETKVYEATVTVKNGPGRYSYPDKIKELQEQSKLAYKAAQNGQTIIDEATGEVIEAAKYTPGGTVLNIKFD